MTTTKYNFSTMFGEDNPLYGMILEVNNATNGLLIYFMLIVVYIVSSYIIMRRTQDINKSLLNSLHIVMILALILFYAGATSGVVLVSEVVMLTLIVAEILGIAGMYYMRMKGA